MNPVKIKILETLNAIPSEFCALKEHSLKYLKYSSIIDDDMIGIGHRPWVAPYNFAISLFSPAKKTWFSKYKLKCGKPIPVIYQKFLSVANGCFYYDFDLYGLTPSIQKDNLLDRTKLQCHDLGTANEYWINAFNVDKNSFHFGGRALNDDENVGYFINQDNAICVKKNNGETISQYSSFYNFLETELKIAENMMIEETPGDWWN